MGIKSLKYLSILSIPITVYFAFTQRGLITFLPLFYAFVIIPLLELILGKNPENLNKIQEDLVRENWIYDAMLYLIVPLQFAFLVWFLFAVGETDLGAFEKIGRTTGMGLLCGLFGINVAHELGHRANKAEQFMSKALLLSTQYIHFFIEHNEGHHRNVSTPDDPASARFNESLYAFFLRSIYFSYVSAWKIESKRLKRKKLNFVSFQNRMLVYSITQLGVLIFIGIFFGFSILVWYIAASVFGILLLETINYIEHYGLLREKVNEFRYEDASPLHSWNSDHVIGRIMLYELSRHSDHHANPERKYQVLRHHDHSPQMPTGYPGMMILAAVPPLWFTVVNPKVKEIQNQG